VSPLLLAGWLLILVALGLLLVYVTAIVADDEEMQ
jgi:hypothetical protein